MKNKSIHPLPFKIYQLRGFVSFRTHFVTLVKLQKVVMIHPSQPSSFIKIGVFLLVSMLDFKPLS